MTQRTSEHLFKLTIPTYIVTNLNYDEICYELDNTRRFESAS